MLAWEAAAGLAAYWATSRSVAWIVRQPWWVVRAGWVVVPALCLQFVAWGVIRAAPPALGGGINAPKLAPHRVLENFQHVAAPTATPKCFSPLTRVSGSARARRSIGADNAANGCQDLRCKVQCWFYLFLFNVGAGIAGINRVHCQYGTGHGRPGESVPVSFQPSSQDIQVMRFRRN